MGSVILFVGIDGSGKTTQAQKLVGVLNAHGKKCTYAHQTSLFEYFFSKMKRLERKTKSAASESKDTLFEMRTRSKLFSCILFFLSLLNGLLPCLVTLGKSKKEIVVCDRFFYDHLVPYAWGYTARIIPYTLKIFPQPDVIFFFDVLPEVAFERRKEATISFYAHQHHLYHSFKTYLNPEKLVVIDANKDKNKVAEKIYQYVMSIFRNA